MDPKMKSYLIICVLLAIPSISCTAETVPAADGDGTVRLNVASEMMQSAASSLNSHAEEEQWSRLQPMYGTYIVLPHKWLLGDVPEDQNFANYPRIKKMADGKYIMFYHGGQYGSRIWSVTSPDLKTWSTPVMHYSPVRVTVDGEDDWRRFVNMDAVVLRSGDILAVCSYRAAGHYGEGKDGGLMLIRSSDNGKTWTEPQKIYDGVNWEAYLLELPDGRIQCYFTDPIPQTRNSGTSLIVSEDGGYTWSRKIRVCRQYKYDYDGPNMEYTGQKIYTDQMPCFRVLNDGKTIAGFLEARLETPLSVTGASYCKMSMVWNDELEWKDLGEESAGPEKRVTNFMKGGSGYMATFPSGEVVISCNSDSRFMLKVLDRNAECPYGSIWIEDWMYPFPGKGFWGSVETDSPVTLVGAMHDDTGIQIERFWLNHRIDAASEDVTVDGNASEWGTSQALYLASESGTETIFRSARDADNLYLAVETACPSDNQIHELYLKFNNSSKSGTVTVRITPSGEVTASGAEIGWASSKAVAKDGRDGIVTELGIPLSVLEAGDGDYIRFFAKAVTSGSTATFSLSDQENPDSWQRIRLAGL